MNTEEQRIPQYREVVLAFGESHKAFIESRGLLQDLRYMLLGRAEGQVFPADEYTDAKISLLKAANSVATLRTIITEVRLANAVEVMKIVDLDELSRILVVEDRLIAELVQHLLTIEGVQLPLPTDISTAIPAASPASELESEPALDLSDQHDLWSD
jgi:hypothetical protein